jgi:exonuclease SbcC
MVIRAKYARFINWKFFQDVTFHFNEKVTDISGDNGTGKSTLADGLPWLFTGKDRQNKADFNIKNNVLTDLNKLDHVDEWGFDVDGSEVVLRRVYKEVWQRVKQAETPTLKGNTTEYFINDAPFTATQYDAFIATWANETTFKILTDPMFFNTLDGDRWTWKKQREILAAMAGEITYQEVLEESDITKPRQKVLAGIFEKGTPLENYKNEIKAKKKLAVEELTPIQPTIDGKVTAKPQAEDWKELERLIDNAQVDLERVDGLISDKSKIGDDRAKSIADKRRQIRGFELEVDNIKDGIQRKIKRDNDEIRDKRATLESDISRIQTSIKSLESDNKANLQRIESVTTEYNSQQLEYKEKKREKEPDFDGEDAVCKVCEQPLKPEVIAKNKEKFLDNWRTEKVKKLNWLKESAEKKVAEIQELKSRVSNAAEKIESLEKELAEKQKELDEASEIKLGGAEELNKQLSENKDATILKGDIIKSQEELKKLEDVQDGEDELKEELERLKLDKKETSTKLDALKIRLSKKDDIDRIDKQIKELEEKKKALTQVVADYEGMEHAVKNYEFTRAQIIQRRVNRLFRVDDKGKQISFKMFRENVDKTDREEWCELVYDGNTWSALNTGAKIWAGLECINAFNKFYNKYLPVIIDNRESTVRIPEMETQIINLRVDETVPVITVMN